MIMIIMFNYSESTIDHHEPYYIMKWCLFPYKWMAQRILKKLIKAASKEKQSFALISLILMGGEID